MLFFIGGCGCGGWLSVGEVIFGVCNNNLSI